MSKIAIFLADGFEEIEGLTVVDICRRCGLTIDMVSITEDRQVMGSHKIPVTADMTLYAAWTDAETASAQGTWLPAAAILLLAAVLAWYNRRKHE